MTSRRLLKKPSDYPLFVFRLKTLTQKKRLSTKLDRARRVANADFGDTEKKYCKNELIEFALTHGLDLLISGKIKMPG